MTIIAAGANATFTITPGSVIRFVGNGTLNYGPGLRQGAPVALQGVSSIGPYAWDQSVSVLGGAGGVDYEVTLPVGELVISPDSPNDSDGRPDGTIFIQTA